MFHEQPHMTLRQPCSTEAVCCRRTNVDQTWLWHEIQDEEEDLLVATFESRKKNLGKRQIESQIINSCFAATWSHLKAMAS